MVRIVYPTAFGDRPRSPLAIRKAAEWKAWVKAVSPVVLQGRLPEPYYREWVNLVRAIGRATAYSIRADDIPRLRIMLARFVRHYEELYYQHKLARLPACRSVFHALLHVADCVEWLGPMWPYAQWTMERMCGLWVPKVKLKQQADRNLSLALLREAQLHCLPYAVDTQHTTDDSGPSRDMVDKLFSSDLAEDADNRQVLLFPSCHSVAYNRQVYSSDDYAATLHSPVKEHLCLN